MEPSVRVVLERVEAASSEVAAAVPAPVSPDADAAVSDGVPVAEAVSFERAEDGSEPGAARLASTDGEG